MDGDGEAITLEKTVLISFRKLIEVFNKDYIKITPKNGRKDRENIFTLTSINVQAIFLASPQHFLYFFPLPHGHGSLRPTEA